MLSFKILFVYRPTSVGMPPSPKHLNGTVTDGYSGAWRSKFKFSAL